MPDLFIDLFQYICILWLGMILHYLTTLCGSAHVTEPQWASTQGHNVFWDKTESLLHAWDVRLPTAHYDSAGVTASCIIGPYFFDGPVCGVKFITCGIMLYQNQATM